MIRKPTKKARHTKEHVGEWFEHAYIQLEKNERKKTQWGFGWYSNGPYVRPRNWKRIPLPCSQGEFSH